MELPPYEVFLSFFPGPRTPETPTKVYTGGCHCGRIKFECRHPILEDTGFEVVRCNCSYCTIKGWLLIYITERQINFKITSGSLSDCHRYTSKTNLFTHLSCPDCAAHLFCEEPYDMMAVNIRCLDGIKDKSEQLPVRLMDGKKL